MEPVKGGILVNLPDEAQRILSPLNGGSNAGYALRFAGSFPQVAMILSGMSDMSQMQDNINTMKDFQPLNETEMDALRQVVDVFSKLKMIPCTSCKYCIEQNKCPQNIRIPELFGALNKYGIFHSESTVFVYNNFMTGHGSGKASDCIQCGMCEDACPQHLPIRDLLEQVARTLERP